MKDEEGDLAPVSQDCISEMFDSIMDGVWALLAVISVVAMGVAIWHFMPSFVWNLDGFL